MQGARAYVHVSGCQHGGQVHGGTSKLGKESARESQCIGEKISMELATGGACWASATTGTRGNVEAGCAEMKGQPNTGLKAMEWY